MSISEILAKYRKKLGLTQEGLASQLGVTNQAVSKWESGQSCPDIALLPRPYRNFLFWVRIWVKRKRPGTKMATRR